MTIVENCIQYKHEYVLSHGHTYMHQYEHIHCYILQLLAFSFFCFFLLLNSILNPPFLLPSFINPFRVIENELSGGGAAAAAAVYTSI